VALDIEGRAGVSSLPPLPFVAIFVRSGMGRSGRIKIRGFFTVFRMTLQMIAEIIAAGSEMLTPFRQDTNSLYLTAELNALGVQVAFKTIVGDNLEHLTGAARIASSRADIVIFSGGLGPTEDDLTREAVGRRWGWAAARQPRFLTGDVQAVRRAADDHAAEQREAGRCAGRRGGAGERERQRAGPVHRHRGGAAPEDRDSAAGAAEGAEADVRGGVPAAAGGDAAGAAYGEADAAHGADSGVAGGCADGADLQAVPDVETTILAARARSSCTLCARRRARRRRRRGWTSWRSGIEAEMGEAVFSSHGESLEEVVLLMLGLRHMTLAAAESCTGGLLAERLTAVPGSSRYFLGGAVVYADRLKTTFADVPEEMVRTEGPVSERWRGRWRRGFAAHGRGGRSGDHRDCRARGGGARDRMLGEADRAGVCGDLVCGGVSTRWRLRGRGEGGGTEPDSGDRERIRWWASQHALELLRRSLMERM
jgi:nicotinamide-nucleotide amidase